ncbi:MAG: aminoglycoside phosphotransferase family protein [Oscillospiraceae bacterium]|jgi:hypothetical protein|nr:aminoglycoside phosphotransferase family protein [Oscillospiraceae bacterium]
MLHRFLLDGKVSSIEQSKELMDGHINRTFAITAIMQNGAIHRYLLQKINTFVFKNPEQLMSNIVRVTGYLREQFAKNPDETQCTLRVYPTTEGSSFYRDESGDCWRCYDFLEDTYSLQTGTLQDAYRAAKAFGLFQRMMDGFPIDQLYETIPDFHNTQKRYEALEAAAASDTVGRSALVRDEIAFARARKADASRCVDMIASGDLPLRVTHNDTKLNNVLFAQSTGESVCVVDLDTVMPGLSLYDFGDSLRFLGNTASEDERDLSLVSFNLPLFEAYAKGYLETAGRTLTENELRLLPFSIKLMTLECGMRFLTDYLDGDVYFRVHRPDDNIARCRTQFKLVEHIEAAMPAMEDIVRSLVANL